MKNIILVGMPGCGKSTVGKLLAKLLDVGFTDCDKVIEEAENTTISNIFSVHGEEYFRNLETQTLKSLLSARDLVIATGGGCVERPENRELLKKIGTVVFINRPLKFILKDINTAKRPLLADGKEKLFELYKKRLPLYKEVCDIEIKDLLYPKRLAQKIIYEVNKNG